MPADSPWKTLKEGGLRVNRSKHFLRREVTAGRLRAARIGGRGEILTRDEWLDEWVMEHTTPIVVSRRRVG